MITLERARELVEGFGDSLSDVKIDDEQEYVVATLSHPSDLGIRVVVHPDEEALILRVAALNLGRIDFERPHERYLRRLNERLVLGKLVIDGDGDVAFDITHACLDGGAEDPAPEVLERMLKATATTASDVARLVMSMRLQDANVPQKMVEEVLETTFASEAEADGML